MTDWSPGVYPETRQAKPPDLRSAQDKTTSWTGHFLAGHEALDKREAAVGLGLLRIRRRQLDEAVQQRLFGTVEVARPRPEVQSTTPDLDSVVKDRVSAPVAAPDAYEPAEAPHVEPEASQVVEDGPGVVVIAPSKREKRDKGETGERSRTGPARPGGRGHVWPALVTASGANIGRQRPMRHQSTA